jgi:ADP-ribose pyrophosphatase YjhB (NUDIX family)
MLGDQISAGVIVALLTDRGRRGLFSAWMSLRALTRPVAFGAVGAVFDQAGRVLLVRQSYAPGWRLPGGGVGWGEAPEAAARRELSEEVGLSGGAASLFGLYTRKAGLATHLVAVYRITGAQVAFQPNWEVREILFADPAAPPPGTVAATGRRLRELTGAEKISPWW